MEDPSHEYSTNSIEQKMIICRTIFFEHSFCSKNGNKCISITTVFAISLWNIQFFYLHFFFQRRNVIDHIFSCVKLFIFLQKLNEFHRSLWCWKEVRCWIIETMKNVEPLHMLCIKHAKWLSQICIGHR